MVQKIKSSNLDADILTGNTELAEAANNADTVLVHDTSAGTLKKIQVSNLTAQAGDGLAKTNSTLSIDIPNTTLLDAGAASNDEVLIYDTSAGALKSITQTNLLNFPTVSSVSPTSLTSGDGTGNYTIVITGTGFGGATASLLNASGSTVNFDSQTVDSITQITGVIAKSSLPGTGEPYDVRVSASSGLQSTLENQINIDQQPAFSTAAGSLGTVLNADRGSTTFTVVAADPESGGDVVYTLESGSLPAGCSLTSTSSGAVLSGFDAVGTNTTSNFTIRAKDVNSNTSDRAFSITVQAPVSQSFTSSGTFSVPSGVSTVQVLVVAGGGSGGASIGGGGGAGGLVYHAGYPVTPGGTETVTVGDGGAGKDTPTPSSPSTGNPGNNSTFGTITAIGGGGGGSRRCGPYQGTAGAAGGSGGGGSSSDHSPSYGGGSAQQGQSGSPAGQGYGNAGGSGKVRFPHGSGGGGGAGAAAGSANNPQGTSAGGVGLAYTIADGTTSVYYAGGGAGVSDSGGDGGLLQSGGQGGGGQSNYNTVNGDGVANRGGGGGAGSFPSTLPNNTSGAGGKGVVIVRWG